MWVGLTVYAPLTVLNSLYTSRQTNKQTSMMMLLVVLMHDRWKQLMTVVCVKPVTHKLYISQSVIWEAVTVMLRGISRSEWTTISSCWRPLRCSWSSLLLLWCCLSGAGVDALYVTCLLIQLHNIHVRYNTVRMDVT